MDVVRARRKEEERVRKSHTAFQAHYVNKLAREKMREVAKERWQAVGTENARALVLATDVFIQGRQACAHVEVYKAFQTEESGREMRLRQEGLESWTKQLEQAVASLGRHLTILLRYSFIMPSTVSGGGGEGVGGLGGWGGLGLILSHRTGFFMFCG